MKIANQAGRLVLVRDERALDVGSASSGRFGPDPQRAFADWDAFCSWARDADGPTSPLDPARLGAPSPSPRQVFGIGLNYRGHVEEAETAERGEPLVFTKFPSCITGPHAEVEIADDLRVDWEVELVIIIGLWARSVPVNAAWEHVAGLTIGQDISDRRLQFRDGAQPQFSLGKSRPGFGPTGPYLVTPDELDDPMDLELRCTLSGELMQSSRTGHMIHDVPTLVSKLSAVLPLLPGDLIFTGTPEGTGVFRRPRRFIRPGEVLVSTIEGLGSMTTTFIRGSDAEGQRHG